VMAPMHLQQTKKTMKRQRGFIKLTKKRTDEVTRFKYSATESSSNSK